MVVNTAKLVEDNDNQSRTLTVDGSEGWQVPHEQLLAWQDLYDDFGLNDASSGRASCCRIEESDSSKTEVINFRDQPCECIRGVSCVLTGENATAATINGIYLDSCFMEGTISKSIQKLSDLRVFHVYENKLSGTIPPEMNDLTGIIDFRIDSNLISGFVPDLQGLQDIGWLSAVDNAISGCIMEIPNCITPYGRGGEEAAAYYNTPGGGDLFNTGGCYFGNAQPNRVYIDDLGFDDLVHYSNADGTYVRADGSLFPVGDFVLPCACQNSTGTHLENVSPVPEPVVPMGEARSYGQCTADYEYSAGFQIFPSVLVIYIWVALMKILL